MSIDLSVLDLVPVPSGTAPSQAVRDSIDLAMLAESHGYKRYWISEHHSMPAIASSSPEVLLSRIGALTERIRIGSGGIMLPNHAPMRVAEHFRTLEALYPGRVDLGLGRAPGSDMRANRALHARSGEHFAEMLDEMRSLSEDRYAADHPYAGVKVVPEDVPLPPIWILGSSGASADMAGAGGYGYSFASHFSPMPAEPALERYRYAFEPSAQFSQPHTILGVSVICAPTDEEAEELAATVDLMWLRLRKGQFLPLPSPAEAHAYSYSDIERNAIKENRARHIIGSPETVRAGLEDVASRTRADELMIVSNIHDAEARLRSYALVADALST
ncbi:LLM class flavin-dependent oxidoreductase [Salinisphaera hydrothermalis]|uniref:Luciferase-like monooxygenase n=1 Tax=Salinisphaera hydrothermalis (strain C41B8) TaxID=1304275 RepID=A0A084IN52_SALHC|nr:LLM class flavin-dependent oxidoreductase [Salinisphaera hydrothermalis]KEZ78136.1 luciferase-like protein [Salinisphaera hydrothermalis C41B8]